MSCLKIINHDASLFIHQYENLKEKYRTATPIHISIRDVFTTT